MYESISFRGEPRTAVTNHRRADARNPPSCASGPQWSSFDLDYVQRLRDGDPETERHFTAYFGHLLLIKFRARLRHPQTIDDILQETFLRVLTALKTKNCLQSPQSLGAFVNSVANNLLFESYRTQSRQQIFQTDEQFDPPDHQASAEMQMVTEERRQQVQKVLDELPAQDRELLRMIFCEEADQGEICKSFHTDRGYLRVLIHRAKARFRDCLLKQYEMRGQQRV